MAQRKIIENSDDDEEREVTPPLSIDGEESRADLDYSLPSKASSSTAVRSLSSTEVLYREMQAAHKSLLEATPVHLEPFTRVSQHFQQGSPSQPSSLGKLSRRAKTCLEKSERTKTIKTYGSQEGRRSYNTDDIFEFHRNDHADIETPRSIRQRSNGIKTIEVGHAPTSSFPGTTTTQESSFDRDIPQASVRKHLQRESQHSESGTIPTVADSTPVQHPDMTMPGKTISFTDAGSFSPTYFDGHMPTPTISPRNHSIDSVSFTKSQDDSQRVVEIDTNNETREVEALQEPTSSAAVISPNRSIAVKSAVPDMPREVDIDRTTADELQLSPPSFHTVGSTRPMVVLSDHCNARQMETVNLPEEMTDVQAPMRPPNSRKRKHHGHNENDELGSDDTAIGMPKEQYQPRPSRSRGSNNNDELVVPTDFSKRPEAIAKPKKRSKRCKTTSFVELIPKQEGDEDEAEDEKPIHEVAHLKIPAFAKREDEHQGEAKTDIEDNAIEKEPPDNYCSPKKQRGRPKKTPGANVIVAQPDEHTDTIAAIDGHANASDPTKSTKRGRPSKKSMAIIEEDTDNEQNTGSAEDGRRSLTPSRETDRVLAETSGNVAPAKLVETSPEIFSSPSMADPPPATPQKPAPSAVKGPDKHSPISGGNIAYRVGLSKRARIEPLLRMVRK